MADDDDWILFRLQRLDPLRFEALCFALLKAKGRQTRRRKAPTERQVGAWATAKRLPDPQAAFPRSRKSPHDPQVGFSAFAEKLT